MSSGDMLVHDEMTSDQGPGQDGDFPFDFLSFMGLDGNPEQENLFQDHSEPTDGQSNMSDVLASIMDQQDAAPDGRSSKPRTRRSRRNKNPEDDMEVDQAQNSATATELPSNNSLQPLGPSGLMGIEPAVNSNRGMEMGLSALSQGQNGDFDLNQASGLLQQQLEQIHMQSPAILNPSNDQNQSPYVSFTQMTPELLNSMVQQLQNSSQGEEGNRMESQQYGWSAFGSGLLTPAQSGEMQPQQSHDAVMPMHLDMNMNKGHMMNGQADIGTQPLLSPALSGPAGSSTYASPSNAFVASNHNNEAMERKKALQKLQEQQAHFQQQLLYLQQQQQQLEATAAAVASSPYLPNNSNSTSLNGAGSSSRAMTVTTPGLSGPLSAGGLSSPGYFSPLTSPALEARHRSQNSGQFHFGSSSTSTRSRPVSAFSSPALNPVGSSGGAQQTLSPALMPQTGQDVADTEYLQSLMGYTDNTLDQDQSQNPANIIHNQPYQSPHLPSNQNTYRSSPLVSASNNQNTSAPGPNRHSLPAKSRPSPLIKPTGRTSLRQGSGSHTSSPNSPIALKHINQAPSVGNGSTMNNMGYLPPAAIQPNHFNHNILGGSQGGSTPSTPSPVDLSAIMPPPPVPSSSGQSNQRFNNASATPMTPATLMSIDNSSIVPSRANVNGQHANARQQSSNDNALNNGFTGSAPSADKKSGAGATSVGAAGRRGAAGGKITASAAGKRALAMRLPGITHMRSAASRVPAAAPPTEGETKKTSHKAAEQKRRDSLKAGFDELRLLLPAINTEALDPESGEPIPGSSAPRLLPKSSLVPDDNPNRGVSKVALLKFSNEYIVRLHEKVEKRDDYIDKLRDEIKRLRVGDGGAEIRGDEGEDLLEMDMADGEEDDFNQPLQSIIEAEGEEETGEDMDDDDDAVAVTTSTSTASRRKSVGKGGATKSPALKPVNGAGLGRKGSLSNKTRNGGVKAK